MPTSIRRRTDADDLLEAVTRLGQVRPHVDADVRLGAADYRVYWQGYYRAIVAALQVMELALRRHETRRREARRQAREAKRERASIPEAGRIDGRQAHVADRNRRGVTPGTGTRARRADGERSATHGSGNMGRAHRRPTVRRTARQLRRADPSNPSAR